MKGLRHRNGRGLLYDDAEANRSTYIDKTSSASGFAKLRDARLVVGASAEGNCQIYGGDFHSTIISGHTICGGYPHVIGSILDCSEVSGQPIIINSKLLGTTEVCDEPRIQDAELRDAIVYGKPYLTKGVYTGRIHEGVWLHPPKHIKLPWCDLSECIDGKLLLNCYCRPVVWWLRFGPKVAKKWDWSDDMVSVTLDTIRKEFT